MDNWISVDSYKDVPIGRWLVQVEDHEYSDNNMHVMTSRKNLTLIGNYFAFDMPRVIAYQPLPPETSK